MTSPDAARRHGETRQRELRARIANEAARLITEQGLSYAAATRKAADRIGAVDPANLPKQPEIESALREYQRLFRHDEQPEALRARRDAALEAMRFFARWQPRLVGAVLDGTADEHAAVVLHLFVDDVVAVTDFLGERRIPYVLDAVRLRQDRERTVDHPRVRFDADDIGIELIVFPEDGLRAAPLGRDGKPIERANAAAVAALLRTAGLK